MKQTNKNQLTKNLQNLKPLKRPRTTYIYSIAVNSACADRKVIEVSTITTNNRYLQNQDHCLATYNLMKMANYLKMPIIQFVGDGDSRFKLQMMLMGALNLKDDESFHTNSYLLEQNREALIREGQNGGWNIRRPSLSDMFHFLVTAEELKLADFASNAIKKILMNHLVQILTLLSTFTYS